MITIIIVLCIIHELDLQRSLVFIGGEIYKPFKLFGS